MILDAGRLVKQFYHIDTNKTQFSKRVSGIPSAGVVAVMGCTGGRPFLPRKHRGNGELDNPAGKSEEEFAKEIKQMEKKMYGLRVRS